MGVFAAGVLTEIKWVTTKHYTAHFQAFVITNGWNIQYKHKYCTGQIRFWVNRLMQRLLNCFTHTTNSNYSHVLLSVVDTSGIHTCGTVFLISHHIHFVRRAESETRSSRQRRMTSFFYLFIR